MYPISLDLSTTRIALIGNGTATLRRLEQLDADNARHVTLFADAPCPALAKAAGSRLRACLPDTDDLKATQIVMIVGIDEERAETIADQAHKLNKLVNVEDVKHLCDFHFISFMRRGDLLLTVSTGGKSPALGGRIRKELEELFGNEWEERLENIAEKRRVWKRAGYSTEEILKLSDEYMYMRNWFSNHTLTSPPSLQREGASTVGAATNPLPKGEGGEGTGRAGEGDEATHHNKGKAA